jgi:hypothetical protein
MTRSASVSELSSEFDGFLFAPVWADGNGMLVSVLSALARLNVDPWQEAADLARLPGDRATRRLASLISALPGRPSTHPDTGATAARLIVLLPHRSGPDIASPKRWLGADGAINPWVVLVMWAMLSLLTLGAQLTQGQGRRPGQPDSAIAQSSLQSAGTVSRQMPQRKPGP